MQCVLMLAQDESQSMTVLDYIRAGGMPGYLILALSVLGVALTIYLAAELRLTRLAPQREREMLSRLFQDGSVPEAIKFCEDPENACFLARMFGASLKRCSRSQLGLLELQSALEENGQQQVERLYRVVDWVALIAAVAPMLGLLGTVFGMIGAFGTIGALEGAARSKALASHMSLALVATAMGLIVAIPCTAVFSFARRRIDTLAEQVGEVAESLAADLTTRLTGTSPQRPSPRAPRSTGEVRTP